MTFQRAVDNYMLGPHRGRRGRAAYAFLGEVSTTSGVHPGASFISIWKEVGADYPLTSWLESAATFNRRYADAVVAAMSNKGGRYSGLSCDFDSETHYLQVRGVAAVETGTATIQNDIRASLTAAGLQLSGATFLPLTVLNNVAPKGQPANPKPNASPFNAGTVAKQRETPEQIAARIAADVAAQQKAIGDTLGFSLETVSSTIKNITGLSLAELAALGVGGLLLKKFLLD